MTRNMIQHRVREDAPGQPSIDQGLVHGLPVSFNPDINAFHVHAPGTTDGTNVLATAREWRNLVQRARRLAQRGAATATVAGDTGSDDRCPKCGAEQRGQPVTDPDGRLVCGECGHAYEPPAGGS